MKDCIFDRGFYLKFAISWLEDSYRHLFLLNRNKFNDLNASNKNVEGRGERTQDCNIAPHLFYKNHNKKLVYFWHYIPIF